MPPDTITAKMSDAKYAPHESGQYTAQCVDCIDLGQKVQDFPGSTTKLAQVCALVFRTGERNEETGEYIDPSKEFTVSMNKKANLRIFLEQWRGKAYTDEQVEAGIPLHKLAGNHALLTISQKASRNGRTYASIVACVGLPKELVGRAQTYTDYVRAEYWAKKRAEYATAAATFKSQQPADVDDSDYPAPFTDEDDSLPF